MLTKKITAVGNSAAVLLSKDLLALLSVEIGDEVEIQVVADTLVLRPLHPQDRAQQFQQAAKRVMAKRHSALQRLAQGSDSPSQD